MSSAHPGSSCRCPADGHSKRDLCKCKSFLLASARDQNGQIRSIPHDCHGVACRMQLPGCRRWRRRVASQGSWTIAASSSTSRAKRWPPSQTMSIAAAASQSASWPPSPAPSSTSSTSATPAAQDFICIVLLSMILLYVILLCTPCFLLLNDGWPEGKASIVLI